MTKDNLQLRKQQLVRNAIYDAAIELFTAKGFDQTTVEEVAQAAGVSRRSFFRYYATKDDLLAQSVVNYGAALTAAIAACPPSLSPMEAMRETVLAGIQHTAAAQPLTRQIVEIAQRSPSARQAHMSRLVEVEDRVSAAYAQRLKNAAPYDLKPRLLASLTVSIINVAVLAWFTGEQPDLSTSARQVFSNLTRLICEAPASTPSKHETKTGRKPLTPAAPKKRTK